MLRRITVLLVTAVLLSVAYAAPAFAEGARIDHIDRLSDRVDVVYVYSPSMNRVIPNRVVHPVGGQRAPTFYLLTGAGGGEDGISWFDNTDVVGFFSNKNVNVVMPVGGRFSMYTDWQADDPILGRNQWTTYLTRELPSVIDNHYATTRVNAISGVSMSAGPALDLAIQAPALYRAVGSYSGCARSSDPVGVLNTAAVVTRGGGNIVNMWGVPGGGSWAAHDPWLRAGELRGKAIYISAASGLPGPIDGPFVVPSPVEAVADGCTASMASRLSELGIPATYVRRSEGAHTWGLFTADLYNSWPLIGGAIGA
ncbi:alpha/beta hydrolase [Actinomycetes bacterium M1A6_2h]